MQILLDSHFFYPSIGGVEMMTEGLARAWQSKGHQVCVTTKTSLDGHEEHEALSVVRSPSPSRMGRLTRRADVMVRSGNALRSLPWPVLTNTALVTIHHRALSRTHLGRTRSIVEKLSTYVGTNVAVSSAVAPTIPGPVVQIPNAFRPIFDQLDRNTSPREGLLYVGRLVQEKGVDVAIQALSCLHERKRDERLTICGDGPYRDKTERAVQRMGLQNHVTFTGWASPSTLAELYLGAEAVLVPSRRENFGLVALEAIASGCPVVASNVGGLPEAVGKCGVLVEPNSPVALADGIEAVLQTSTKRSLRTEMSSHVGRHRMDRIATDYLHLLRRVACWK